MAPGLVAPEKAARGKLPTDVWWHTIVPTKAEKTGYPTQKPEGILRRIVLRLVAPGRLVLDFFAGSGTTGAVAARPGRRFVLVDESAEATSVASRRIAAIDGLRAAPREGRRPGRLQAESVETRQCPSPRPVCPPWPPSRRRSGSGLPPRRGRRSSPV